jgi:hypothetical protein
MSFTINPFTGNLDEIGQGGGGGGGITSLVPDSGAAISSAAAVISGQAAGSAPVVFTSNVGGELMIEDRAWQTPYVVDPSATVGLRGTYQTIQAAIDAAVVDGMTFSNPKIIYVRAGTYTEDLAIAGGSHIIGANAVANNAIIVAVSIIGAHVLGAAGVFYSENIQWQGNGATAQFSGAGAAAIISLKNCIVAKASGGYMVDISSQCTLCCTDCWFIPNSLQQEFIIPNANACNFINCTFNGAGFDLGGGLVTFFNCTSIGPVNLNGSVINAFRSSFIADSENNINQPTGNGGAVAYCSFASNTTEGYAISSVGNTGWTVQDCYIVPNATGPGALFDPGTNLLPALSTVGNVLQGVRVEDDYTTVKDNYVGVTNTAAARTIEIAWPMLDYEITVADETGAANVNFITVQDSAGGEIDGQPSVIIDQAYGSKRFHAIGGGNWLTVGGNILPKQINVSTMKDDFVGAFANSLQLFSEQTWLNVSSASGTIAFGPVASTSNEHPGIISSGALTVGQGDLNLFMGVISGGATVVPSYVLGNGITKVTHIFKINALSDGTNTYVYRIGLGDTRSADQANGVYLEYTHSVNSGQWVTKSANGGVRSTSNSSIAVDTAWHRLDILVDATNTSVVFFLDDVFMATGIATNLPAGAVTPMVSVIWVAGTIGAGNFLQDAVFLTKEITTSR